MVEFSTLDKGGFGGKSLYNGIPLITGDSIGLGEHVKLAISGDGVNSYKYCFFEILLGTSIFGFKFFRFRISCNFIESF